MYCQHTLLLWQPWPIIVSNCFFNWCKACQHSGQNLSTGIEESIEERVYNNNLMLTWRALDFTSKETYTTSTALFPTTFIKSTRGRHYALRKHSHWHIEISPCLSFSAPPCEWAWVCASVCCVNITSFLWDFPRRGDDEMANGSDLK